VESVFVRRNKDDEIAAISKVIDPEHNNRFQNCLFGVDMHRINTP
jgi:hypothetical protein